MATYKEEEMEKIIRVIDRITNFFSVIAGIVILLGVVLVIIEILVRTLFSSSIYIAEEYSGYFMVAITFFGMSYTLKEKDHIQITFFKKIVKNDTGKAILEIFTYCVGLALFAVITVVTGHLFLDTAISGTQSMQVSNTYLAIPQLTMPLGSFIITLQFVSEILKSILVKKQGTINKEETLESGEINL